MPIGDDERLCETASSWRLLSGGFAPGFSHRPYNTTSREPPPQISTAVRTSPQIGAGGMGVVYKATDTKTSSPA